MIKSSIIYAINLEKPVWKSVFLLLFVMNISCNNREPKVQKPKLMILGTMPFEEKVNWNEENSEDIELLVSLISNYKPTKILIKNTLKQEIKSNDFVLNQIINRLCKNNNLTDIVLLDSSYYEKPKYSTNLKKTFKSDDLIEFYKLINNTDNLLKIKSFFIEKNCSVKNNTNFLSNWYNGNINLMTNINKHLEENERILVIVDLQDKVLLEYFYKLRGSINYMEINNYLEPYHLYFSK